MEGSWNALVEDLECFPGSVLQLQEASQWQQVGSAYILVSLGLGEVYDSKRLKLMIATDIKGTNITLTQVEAAPCLEQEQGCKVNKTWWRKRGSQQREAVPDGVQDAIAIAGRAVAAGAGPRHVRSALVRLCHELYVELSPEQSSALSALGQRQVEPPCEPLPLARGASRASQGTSGGFSFEDDDDGLLPTDSEDGDDAALEEQPRQAATASSSSRLRLSAEGPPVKEVVLWTCVMDGLKRLPGSSLKLEASGVWDGREGLVELSLHGSPEKHDWEQLRVMLIVSNRRATSIELKGAQVVPSDVASAVAEVNGSEEIGSGPDSLSAVILALADAVDLELSDEDRAAIEVLGDRQSPCRIDHLSEPSSDTSRSGALQRELLAVEALKVQSGLIEQQIKHLEQRLVTAVCIAPGLEKEVARLQRSFAEVTAEKKAASAAVQAAMLELTDTGHTAAASKVPIEVLIEDVPSQSVRGHGAQSASQMICQALQSAGAWGHYAAYQFASMISREQQLQGEYVCFYHSYSVIALMYEVQAEVARRVLGLPADSAPVPRLAGAASGDCRDLASLRKMGGSDHNPGFRALGLSCSCSIFANSSEAPPLTCFQGGYSCTDVQFRQRFVDFFTKCCGGDSKQGEVYADATIKVGQQHNMDTSVFGGEATSRSRSLAGYMLQIFVHRSIVKDYVYASEAMGKPIDTPILQYLEGGRSANGQARILFQPKVFLNPAKARLFHYCARPLQSCMDSEVAASRGSLLKSLKSALAPMFAKHPAESVRKRLGLA